MRVIKHGQSALCVYIDIYMYIDNHLGHGKFQYLMPNTQSVCIINAMTLAQMPLQT